MTFDEVLELGREKLLEYEPRLKGRVRGTKPYDGLRAKSVSRHYEGSLSAAKKEVIEQVVGSVLDELIELAGDAFWMSEPKYHTPIELQQGYEMQTIRQENLSLTFASGYSIQDNTSHLLVTCWYEV